MGGRGVTNGHMRFSDARQARVRRRRARQSDRREAPPADNVRDTDSASNQRPTLSR